MISSKLNKFLKNGSWHSVAKNFGYLTILQGVNFILPLVTLPYLVRVLGSEKFGIIMFAQSFAMFFNVLVDFGFNLSGTQEISVNRNNKSAMSEIFWSINAIKLGLLLVSFALLFGLTEFVPKLMEYQMVFLLSFGVVVGQALFPIWYFQGIEKMRVVTFVNVGAKVIFTLLIVTMIKNVNQYYWVPIYYTMGYVIAGIVGFIIAVNQLGISKPNWTMTTFRFKESSNLFVSNAAVTMYTASNTAILGFFASPSIVGVYASFEKIILAIKNVYSPFFAALFPWIANKDRMEIIKITKKLMIPLGVIGLLGTIFIFFGAEKILQIAFDNEEVTSYSGVFRILGLITFFSALNMLINMICLSALKMYRERMIILVSTGVINVILALVLVKFWGIWGIAITVTFSEFLLLAMGLFFFKRIKE